MGLRLIPLECGRLGGDVSGLIAGAPPGRITLPIASWLLLHPAGSLVFDTGLHRELQTDTKRIGGLAEMFSVDFAPGEEISGRLEAAEFDPGSVDLIVFSHLHFDHCGGTELVPNARIVVQRPEWEAGHVPELIEHDVYNPADFDLGHELLLIDGPHDVFGDGRVRCLPTPGHTAGHQSLRVELDSGPVILTGDCIYMRRQLEQMRTPPFGHDLDQQRASMRELKRLQDEGCRLIFGHDPEQFASIPASGLD
jgi:N-acyl homoserine lactone hydrolase